MVSVADDDKDVLRFLCLDDIKAKLLSHFQVNASPPF